MRVAVLLEALRPRPWTLAPERGPADVVAVAVEADSLGIDRVWLPERHFQEELHHGGAPEALAGAILARTRRIAVGLGPVPLHPALQHPARLALGVATLDRLGPGRVALAAAVPRAGVEVTALGTARARLVGVCERQLATVCGLLADTPYPGEPAVPDAHLGPPRLPAVPARQLVPAADTRPHPPLWWTCDRPEHVRTAARHGLPALVRAPLEPRQAAAWVEEHARLHGGRDAVALGRRADDGVAVCLPVHVGPTPAAAVREGLDAVHLHRHLLDHYERFGAHRPGRPGPSEHLDARRRLTGLDAGPARARPDGPLSLRIAGQLRGAVGDAAQVRALLAAYRDAGVAEVVLVPPLGALDAATVRGSLERLTADVLPALRASGRSGVARRRPRSVPVRAAAAARGTTAETETVVLAREDVAEPAGVTPRPSRLSDDEVAGAAGAAGGVARGLVARAGIVVVETALHRRGPRVLRRALVGGRARRVLLLAMARGLAPAATSGRLRGELQLDVHDGEAVHAYALEALPTGASARVGAAREPRLVLGLTAEDLVRLAAGRLDPARALAEGRLDLRGDLGLAVALGELLRTS